MPDYDVIVVGGGIAGLIAGLRSGQAGRRVLLLEQNHQLGGLAAGIRRQGFYFDVGCQSVIDAGILFPLLKSVGALDGRWRQARFRVVAEQGGYDFVADGLEQVRNVLSLGDPSAAKGLRRCFQRHAASVALIDGLRRFGLPDGRPEESSTVQLRRVAAAVIRHAPRLCLNFCERYEGFYARNLPEGPARTLLTLLGYPGMSTFFAGAVWDCWSRDYWYPDGGLQCWLDDLGAIFQKVGGQIALKKRVIRVVLERNCARAVELSDGTTVSGSQIILAVDLPQVLGELLPRGNPVDPKAKILKSVAGAPLTTPLLTGYIGLNWPQAELRSRMGAAHLFHLPARSRSLPAPDRHGHRRCWLQVAAHSGFATKEEKSAVVVQCFTDRLWQGRFAVGAGNALPRPPAYEQLRQTLKEDLVALLDRALPGAAQAVLVAHVGTPLSTERFTRSPLGSSAGFGWYLPGVPLRGLGWRRKEIRNLYTCGQTTIWPGSVALAAHSGSIAANLSLRDASRSLPRA
jgi:phytoene dehydrogenase-like protein